MALSSVHVPCGHQQLVAAPHNPLPWCRMPDGSSCCIGISSCHNSSSSSECGGPTRKPQRRTRRKSHTLGHLQAARTAKYRSHS
jgi:hypothetical protein